MDNDIYNILKKVIEAIDTVNIRNNREEYKHKKEEIKLLYDLLSMEKKNKLLVFMEKEFSLDLYEYMLLIFILSKSTHDARFLLQMLSIVKNNKVDPYWAIEWEFQINNEVFRNIYNKEESYIFLRMLHKTNLINYNASLNQSFIYIPYSERNINRIVIISDQLLNLNHAPTKIMLEECYTMQKDLDLEVFLVIAPIRVKDIYENAQSDLGGDIQHQNYIDKLCGNNIVTYVDGFDGIISYNENKDQKEIQTDITFTICYKEMSIKGVQVLFGQKSLNQQIDVLKLVYCYKPLFVYNMSCINPLADMCMDFTTVVATSMTSEYPISEASIFLHAEKKVLSRYIDGDMFCPKHVVMWGKKVSIDKPKKIARKKYNIPEDKFVIAIVGNRLEHEINGTFSDALEMIIKIDPSIILLIIGEYNCNNKYFDKTIFKNKIFSIGYQQDLVSIIKLANIYLNPPRQGGGISSLMSLSVGVPVITLPNCDVASNVGDRFICKDMEGIYCIIGKYINDEVFYETQKEYGIQQVKKYTSQKTGLSNAIKCIHEIIRKEEV